MIGRDLVKAILQSWGLSLWVMEIGIAEVMNLVLNKMCNVSQHAWVYGF